MEMLGSHLSAVGTLVALTYTPPNTMKMTITCESAKPVELNSHGDDDHLCG